MNKYYYDKTKAQNKELYCLGIDLDEKELENYVVYQGETPFSGYPIIEGNILRPATLQELVSLGEIVLNVGEKIQDNKIVKIPQPAYYYRWNKTKYIWEVDESLLVDGDYLVDGELKTIAPPESMIVPSWNKEKHIWEEKATDLEKVEHSWDGYMSLNNPLAIRKMTQQGIINDYWTYIDEMEAYIENARQNIQAMSIIPQPTEDLKAFFDKYRGGTNE